MTTRLSLTIALFLTVTLLFPQADTLKKISLSATFDSNSAITIYKDKKYILVTSIENLKKCFSYPDSYHANKEVYEKFQKQKSRDFYSFCINKNYGEMYPIEVAHKLIKQNQCSIIELSNNKQVKFILTKEESGYLKYYVIGHYLFEIKNYIDY